MRYTVAGKPVTRVFLTTDLEDIVNGAVVPTLFPSHLGRGAYALLNKHFVARNIKIPKDQPQDERTTDVSPDRNECHPYITPHRSSPQLRRRNGDRGEMATVYVSLMVSSAYAIFIEPRCSLLTGRPRRLQT